MKELQHRVKNSLAMVSGLLGLEMEGIANARCHAAFEKTRTRIRAVAALYLAAISSEFSVYGDNSGVGSPTVQPPTGLIACLLSALPERLPP